MSKLSFRPARGQCLRVRAGRTVLVVIGPKIAVKAYLPNAVCTFDFVATSDAGVVAERLSRA